MSLLTYSHTSEAIELSQGVIPVNVNAYGSSATKSPLPIPLASNPAYGQLSSVTESALPIPLASNPAYGQFSSPTEESASAYEMVPHPDENEGEHKYDVIPYYLPSSTK